MTTTNELKAPGERVIKNDLFGHKNQVHVYPGVSGHGYPAGVATLALSKTGSRGARHYFTVSLGREDLRKLAQICLEVADDLDVCVVYE
jgi:glutamate/tyrosine decarboxylase-like PLP-dependent enzyme